MTTPSRLAIVTGSLALLAGATYSNSAPWDPTPIKGSIVSIAGDPLGDITVTVSANLDGQSVSHSTKTDANGSFEFTVPEARWSGGPDMDELIKAGYFCFPDFIWDPALEIPEIDPRPGGTIIVRNPSDIQLVGIPTRPELSLTRAHDAVVLTAKFEMPNDGVVDTVRNYRIERSSDLKDWQPFGTASSDGASTELSDAIREGAYYRAVLESSSTSNADEPTLLNGRLITQAGVPLSGITATATATIGGELVRLTTTTDVDGTFSFRLPDAKWRGGVDANQLLMAGHSSVLGWTWEPEFGNPGIPLEPGRTFVIADTSGFDIVAVQSRPSLSVAQLGDTTTVLAEFELPENGVVDLVYPFVIERSCDGQNWEIFGSVLSNVASKSFVDEKACGSYRASPASLIFPQFGGAGGGAVAMP
ncbi:MAG: hypothetical protein ACI9R3_001010 [Verrucomicrobiales bacterium]|jgi:hypothetical protein